MTTMLAPVPLRDQLDEETTDGAPDENARANCVPASLAAALSYLTGRPYYGDELKDAAYGQGYTGATDPARYIAYIGQQGVRMWEVRSSDGNVLVATIRAELALGHPVYGAIPSQWGSTTAADIAAHGGPTHAVMFCDANAAAGTLTAMNPWPVNGTSAFYQTMPAAWWATRLVYGHVYPLSGGHPMSNVVPVWNAANGGTLTYPAHDGIPVIVLDHGQAWYANQNRQGRYPVAPGFYDGNGDSLVGWNDGLDTRAVKANNWQIAVEDSGPRIAAALAEAAQVPSLSQKIAALQQQLASGNTPDAQAIAQIKQVLAALPGVAAA